MHFTPEETEAPKIYTLASGGAGGELQVLQEFKAVHSLITKAVLPGACSFIDRINCPLVPSFLSVNSQIP